MRKLLAQNLFGCFALGGCAFQLLPELISFAQRLCTEVFTCIEPSLVARKLGGKLLLFFFSSFSELGHLLCLLGKATFEMLVLGLHAIEKHVAMRFFDAIEPFGVIKRVNLSVPRNRGFFYDSGV